MHMCGGYEVVGLPIGSQIHTTTSNHTRAVDGSFPQYTICNKLRPWFIPTTTGCVHVPPSTLRATSMCNHTRAVDGSLGLSGLLPLSICGYLFGSLSPSLSVALSTVGSPLLSGSPPGSLWLLLHIPFRLSLSSSGYLSGSLSLALTAFLLLYMALSCFLFAPSRLSLLLLSVSMHPPRLFSV